MKKQTVLATGYQPSPEIPDVLIAAEPSTLAQLLDALGWQGGTIHQALAEVRRLVGANSAKNNEILGLGHCKDD